MKIIISSILLLAQIAFAGPEDQVESLLSCHSNVLGIKSIDVTQDRAGYSEIRIVYNNGAQEIRPFNVRELNSLTHDGLFIAQDNELIITLKKSHIDQYLFEYVLTRTGDGYLNSYNISCVE